MASLRSLGIAVGAGLASALLFLASAKGGAFAFVVYCAVPLPIMIAALGFAQATGLVAAAVASIVTAVLAGPYYAGLFGVVVAFPAWWLAYLALLGRPAAASASSRGALVWFPIGHVVAWAALLTTATFLAFGAATLLHYGSYEGMLAAAVDRVRARLAAADADQALLDQARTVVRFGPPVLAGLIFLILTIDLWIAARVVQGSGLLTRPWPSLPDGLRLPKAAATLLILAVAVAFFGGEVGLAAGIVAVPLSLAFVMQGLGTAHVLTRGLAARRLVLIVIYVVTLSLTPSLLALTILGVVDCLTPLRRTRALPPSPST